MTFNQNLIPANAFILRLLACMTLFMFDSYVLADEAIKVEIIKQGTQYQLFRGGKPYEIKGAGLEYGDIDSLRAHGGNSIRNWSTVNDNETAQEVLDRALNNGITVSLCLQVRSERWGFDYNNKKLVDKQFLKFRKEVVKYRNHPALLTWIIGNELNHTYTNPKVYDAVNDISKMIHELDPNHPTTTTLSDLNAEVLQLVSTRANDLDFISFQVYGKLNILPEFIKETGYDKPFMVTEWGAIGYWEMEETSWGAPVEMNSSEKADNYLKGYQNKLLSLQTQLIGNYVFLWGQKQERTPTWFGLFTERGEETEATDMMHYIWNGKWPDNRSPRLNSMLLNEKSSRENVTLNAGEVYSASVDSMDYDGDNLTYHWEVKPETTATQEGGDFEKNIQSLKKLITEVNNKNINVKAPSQSGAYRLFVYVYDNQGHAAHANIPFYVKD